MTDTVLRCRAARTGPGEAFLNDLKDARPRPIHDPTDVQDLLGSGAEPLSFLRPSAKAGHLGRLGHYEILAVIGRGGMGVVLKAFDESLHRVVAIKVLAPHLAASGTARQRFPREARAAAAVSHDHVVTIHAVEENHVPPYLVMQHVAGCSLQERLDRTGPFRLPEILRIGMQAAEGLAAAHRQGLIHRDVKPGNILLETPPSPPSPPSQGGARGVSASRSPTSAWPAPSMTPA